MVGWQRQVRSVNKKGIDTDDHDEGRGSEGEKYRVRLKGGP